MLDICLSLFSLKEDQIKSGYVAVLSFNVEICYSTNTKLFLDECNYNDGYCYLVLEDRTTNIPKA